MFNSSHNNRKNAITWNSHMLCCTNYSRDRHCFSLAKLKWYTGNWLTGPNALLSKLCPWWSPSTQICPCGTFTYFFLYPIVLKRKLKNYDWWKKKPKHFVMKIHTYYFGIWPSTPSNTFLKREKCIEVLWTSKNALHKWKYITIVHELVASSGLVYYIVLVEITS